MKYLNILRLKAVNKEILQKTIPKYLIIFSIFTIYTKRVNKNKIITAK